MTQKKSPGEVIDHVAARLAAAELVREEIKRLENVILQMEEGASYHSVVTFGREKSRQILEFCRDQGGSESVKALARELYEVAVGRGLDIGIESAGHPIFEPPPNGPSRAPQPVVVPPDEDPPSILSTPEQIIESAVAYVGPKGLVQGRVILGVTVVEKNLQFAHQVINDARIYIDTGSHPKLSQYESNMVGSQAWRKSLFNAACTTFRAEAGLPEPEPVRAVPATPAAAPKPVPVPVQTVESAEIPVTPVPPEVRSVASEPQQAMKVAVQDTLFDAPEATAEGEMVAEEMPEETPSFLMPNAPPATIIKDHWQDPYENGSASAELMIDPPQRPGVAAEEQPEPPEQPTNVTPIRKLDKDRRPGFGAPVRINTRLLKDENSDK